MVDAKRLQRVPPFQHIAPKRLSDLVAISHTQWVEKGQVLFQQGVPADAVWVVLDGWVHLVRSADRQNGKHDVVLFTITPQEALCGVSAIEADTYTSSGVAGTRSEILRIPAVAFNDALTHEPDFAYHTLRLCAQRIRHIAEQYGTMAEPVSKRIIRMILRLREQFGDTLPLTHRELAQMTWTTTESAIRAVRRLKLQGYVKGTRGELTIQRLRALEHALNHSNGRKAA